MINEDYLSQLVVREETIVIKSERISDLEA
jgi:hypothetical protein